MLDKIFHICYNAYAVNYGLKHEVTLITGNQREFMWTSLRQFKTAGDQLKSHFLISHSEIHAGKCNTIYNVHLTRVIRLVMLLREVYI